MAQEQRQPQQGQGQQQQIQIKITDEVLRGAHANMMAVSHTKEEFVLDFMNVFPGQGQGIVTDRVILTPPHAKRVAAALADNIKRYEGQFGTIDAGSPQQPEIGFKAQ